MISELVKKYELEKLFPKLGDSGYRGYDAEDVLKVIIEILRKSYSNDVGDKDDQILFNKFIASNKPITEVVIIRGGVEYKFKKDAFILEMFQDAIDRFNPAGLIKEEMDSETEEMFQHFIEEVRPLFNKITHLRPRKRYLLFFELLKLAGYPFTQQQLNADNQRKATLIGNWLNRSTPKPSHATIKYAQKHFPDIDLLTPILKTKQKGKK